MEALTYDNLIDLDFVSVDDYEVSKVAPMSVNLGTDPKTSNSNGIID
ncbi:MAG: hypothetical protein IJV31_01350 [Clostridia bacterium]|nr:hypothetical protein [Clostridia bacterium]